MFDIIKICVISLNKILILQKSVQFSSVTQSCPTLCNPMDCRYKASWSRARGGTELSGLVG